MSGILSMDNIKTQVARVAKHAPEAAFAAGSSVLGALAFKISILAGGVFGASIIACNYFTMYLKGKLSDDSKQILNKFPISLIRPSIVILAATVLTAKITSVAIPLITAVPLVIGGSAAFFGVFVVCKAIRG